MCRCHLVCKQIQDTATCEHMMMCILKLLPVKKTFIILLEKDYELIILTNPFFKLHRFPQSAFSIMRFPNNNLKWNDCFVVFYKRVWSGIQGNIIFYVWENRIRRKLLSLVYNVITARWRYMHEEIVLIDLRGIQLWGSDVFSKINCLLIRVKLMQ